MNDEQKKNDKTLIEMLKSFFKNLFKKSMDPDEREIVRDKVEEVKEALNDKKTEALESGEFLKAYMLEHQIIGLDKVFDGMNEKNIDKFKPEKIAEMARESINSAVEDYLDCDEISEKFQDYHNHDPVALAEAAKEANSEFAGAVKEAGLGKFANNLNSTSRALTSSAVNFMSQSPESPAVKSGLVDSLDKTNAHAPSKDNSQDVSHEVDSSPAPGVN